MKNTCIVLLLFSLSFISCTTLEPVTPKPARAPLADHALSKLNGSYELYSADSLHTTLDRMLWIAPDWWIDRKERYTVSLQAIDDRQLKVSVYKNGDLIASRIMKGKMQKGSFVIKEHKIIFFSFIMNAFGSSHIRIGLTDSGDLLVDSHIARFGTLILLPVAGGSNEEYNVIFCRLGTG